jgi:hypothetical protein
MYALIWIKRTWMARPDDDSTRYRENPAPVDAGAQHRFFAARA